MHRKELLILAIGSAALCMLAWQPTMAQIPCQQPAGGISFGAPFVQLSIGPLPGGSMQTPFITVARPGARIRSGIRRLVNRIRAQTAPPYYSQVDTPEPTPAVAPPLPSDDDLADLDYAALVSKLRDLSRALQDSLLRFEDPAGWQGYLEIPDDALGTPGTEDVAVQIEVLEGKLEKYDRVASGGRFARIAAMPSFVATHEALRLVVASATQEGPVLAVPFSTDTEEPEGSEDWSRDPGPVTESSDVEALPTPAPVPEPRAGERSILKRR